MIVGLPKEIKNNEHRVGLTPSSVKEIVANGHEVFVEKNCGKEKIAYTLLDTWSSFKDAI